MYFHTKYTVFNYFLNGIRRLRHNFIFQTLFSGIICLLALDSINYRFFGHKTELSNQVLSGEKNEILKNKPTSIENFLQQIVFNDGTENNNITKALYSSMKILCIINSSKKEILNRAQHIHNTWAKRCDKHVFLSQQHEYLTLPFIDVKVPETRPQLWNKIRAAFKWAYDTELNNFDFFLRADDDAYFVMENLRFMLLPFNPNEALYFGARFKVGPPMGFMSGGAGIILTREALKRVVPHLWNSEICPQPETSINDDLELGICAQNLNITPIDTRDNLGRHRMLPWSPRDHFFDGLESHHFKYLFYPYKQEKAFECCADHMISFHYIYNEMLYLMEFLIYHTRLIGIVDNYWYNTLKDNLKNNMSLQELLKVTSIKVFQK